MINSRAKNVAPNISYEFSMLSWAHDQLIENSKPAELRNAYLECFLIHARNLIDFFVKPDSYREDDDVIARDFFDDADVWKKIEREICNFTKSERKDMHKKLAHLTYSRIFQKNWDEKKIYSELSSACSQFLKALEADQKAWFKMRPNI